MTEVRAGVDHHLCGLLLKSIRVKDVCHNKCGVNNSKLKLSVSISISKHGASLVINQGGMS